jgi:small-conductance mechanosensitive channel
MVSLAVNWNRLSGDAVTGLVVAAAVIVLVRLTLALAARRWPSLRQLIRAARIPFRLLVVLLALSPAVAVIHRHEDDSEWWGWAAMAARLLLIVALGWFLTAVAVFVEDSGLRRYPVHEPDNRVARRLRTQTLILRRLTVSAGVLVTVGAVLFSFPDVRLFGASLLASAGLIGVVAGLAAQSVLGNLFAGLQLAFSDAIRLDDAVIVEQEWGWIEEITLSYVVVRLWDDRRMVLPSTYFTTTPFQNWTRTQSELLGSVELDVDWRIDTAEMRHQLDIALEGTDLWDGRVRVLQVTDAIGGWVRVRLLMTARDAPTLFDLRCHVREHMVAWIRDHPHAGQPRQRVEILEEPAPTRFEPVDDRREHGLFHGDAAADDRARRMGTGPIPVQSPEPDSWS